MLSQSAIFAPVPPHASFVFLDLRHGADASEALRELAQTSYTPHLLVGLGPSLLAALSCGIDGLRPLPSLTAPGVSIPATPSALFLRVAGTDPGQVLHRERALLAGLPSFEVVDRVDGFVHGEGRDLSGYEDGTENPTGDDAVSVALQAGRGPGLDGSSVVAVQRWVHDLRAFDAMGEALQDATIGRARVSNEELDDAPASAHVKRTAQEDFSPEAFLLRRSMPWSDHRGAGLVFVSFSATLDPFEAQLRRMMGADDGIVDALFAFTKPVSGGSWWCPPVEGERLDLRVCGGRAYPA